MAEIRIGISGWTYPRWRGVFYPKGLPAARELEYASRQLRTIEINGSFYALQRPSSYLNWHDSVPDDFVFSVKATRFITHIRRLRDFQQPLANFFASGVLALKRKLGPILWQFPPNMKYDPDRFEPFLKALPQNTEQASDLASRHDSWMDRRSLDEADKRRQIIHVVEVRNETFRNPDFFRMLKRHRVGLVISHSTNAWPYFEEQTSDLVYARLHGQGELYSGEYGKKEIDRWARKILDWDSNTGIRKIFLYFDNDAKIKAPFDALALVKRIDALSSIVQRRAA